MPLTVQVTITPVGDPIGDSPETITRIAREHASFGPNSGTPIAITIPKIVSDQRHLHFETRNNDTEFRFDTGTLQLTLRQEIHISNALCPCARTVWLQHENKHVQDNERLMQRMDSELRANAEFAFVLIAPNWQNRRIFADTQRNLQQVVGEVFERLTSSAVARQDTLQEYRTVERQIRLRCGHLIGSSLKLHNYGNGVDMVQVALNHQSPTQLPALKVDGIFGQKTDAKVREFQKNRRLSVDGIVGPDTKRTLGL